ncbi:DeoR family transcriptional regulator [Neobacillus terrae]|uniref:DeoR family transcriptional regulator n=1 Tax=Neobacillus terrae TaxID=3034837 RepID=UPI001408AB5B|nr:DeoR family transcriptional regulator [Neobacillus terrae]NHM33644.1 DeoR/GlpR transcriptional regulator [Neobacillus terrae]
MLPNERRQQLLKWLKDEGPLSISDISTRLRVSEMTVYRDIKPLLEENKIVKSSGGLSLRNQPQETLKGCSYCLKESFSRNPVQIIAHDSQVEQLCCPHCGLLRFKAIEDEVSQIICRDFLNDMTISAKLAHYLLDTDLNLNCCEPQVLTFSSRKQAEQFKKGFGGTVLGFEEAIEEIELRMAGKRSCDCHSSEELID